MKNVDGNISDVYCVPTMSQRLMVMHHKIYVFGLTLIFCVTCTLVDYLYMLFHSLQVKSLMMTAETSLFATPLWSVPPRLVVASAVDVTNTLSFSGMPSYLFFLSFPHGMTTFIFVFMNPFMASSARKFK
jgi:hypothetical protein